MKKSYILMLLVVVFATLQGCKKSNDNPTPTIENTDLLRAWKVSSVLEGTLDITAQYTAYKLTFADDGTTKSYTLVDRSGNTTAGTWAITSDKTSITLTPSSGTATTFSSVSFSATELKYTGDDTGKTGAVTLNFTLVPA